MTGWGGIGDGLLAALVTGLLSLWSLRRSRRGGAPARDALTEAWKGQADELRTELRELYRDRDEDKDRQIVDLQQENRTQAAELKRINKLLNAQRRGGAND